MVDQSVAANRNNNHNIFTFINNYLPPISFDSFNNNFFSSVSSSFNSSSLPNYYYSKFYCLGRKHFKKHFIRFYYLESLLNFGAFTVISKYNKYNYRYVCSHKSLKRLRYLNSLNLKRKPR